MRNRKKTELLRERYFHIALFFLCTCAVIASGESLPEITDDVVTEFGLYQPVIVDVIPSVAPYEINEDLSNVVNSSDFELSEDARSLLAIQGFAARASNFRQIYDVYNECEDRGIPAFITPDACLHSFHILYDYILRIVEVTYFFDDLYDLTQSMINDALATYDTATEASVKMAALNNVAYLSVGLSLLDSTAVIDERVSDIVSQELAKIYELSGGYVSSPLFYRNIYPYLEDYSQYKPRGHYTRTPELERYFRAMMWFGRITFSLDLPYATDIGLRLPAIQALLLARSLTTATAVSDDSTDLTELWDRIYQPTVFFVGKMDDINYEKYLEIARDIYGEDFLTQSPDVLADEEKIDAFISRAFEQLPDPKITVTAGKGFRFMGQRFIPDSYILDQLVIEFVEGRFMPRGLDVIAVLGSDRAYEIIDIFYHDPDLYPGYAEQVSRLRTEFLGYAPEIWAQNLYYNWLYSLLPLLDVKGEGYPLFMQSQAWVDKDLNAALGSWAELRHDTILYAKQSESLKTEEPPEPPLVMGYVEPAPEVYARLAALGAFMRKGLRERNLLHDLFEHRLENFENIMMTLKDISVKELRNIDLSSDEFAFIGNFGGYIEELTSFPPEIQDQLENDADDFMAVIADVHTDPNLNECLEVGVGHPLILYVIAPVNGALTLTRGGIFSYHEFKQPLADERLTDEEWQEIQSGKDAKEMPEWTSSFLAGESSLKTNTFHYPANKGQVTSVDENNPAAFEMLQCHPNPFNPSTTISYRLRESGPVKLTVFNLSGQVVDVLEDGWHESGYYSKVWSPEGLATGIYFVSIVHNNTTKTLKVLFLK